MKMPDSAQTKVQVKEQKPQYKSDPVIDNIGVFSIILMAAALKHFSDESHPMSAREIADKVHLMINDPSHVDEKRVKNNLSRFCDAVSYAKDDNIYGGLSNMIMGLFGGKIVKTYTSDNPAKQKNHERFYFKPLFESSDVEMINGSIISNQYLSDEAKNFLISGENTLTSTFSKNKNAAPDFPDRPKSKNNSQKEILTVINRLYTAIINKWQIRVIYGAYKIAGNIPKVKIEPTNTNAATLNPYAMVWSNGRYYLIATHKGHTNTVTYRIDRIMDVQFARDADDALAYSKREIIPDQLVPYFDKGIFLAEKFMQIYPLCAIHDTENICNCVLTCQLNAIQVIIDTFGKNITIKPDEENDGYYLIPVTAQYENVCRFLEQQHTIIHPVSPDSLVGFVNNRLKTSLEYYE